MSKKLFYGIVSTVLLCAATTAKADTLAISAELVCKTGKAGTDTVVVSGKGSYVNLETNVYDTKPLSYVLGQLNPPIETSDQNLQNQNIPCSLATAATDASALRNFCINSLALSLGITQNTLNIGVNVKFSMSPSTTVVLNNGNIVHHWHGICSTDTFLDLP